MVNDYNLTLIRLKMSQKSGVISQSLLALWIISIKLIYKDLIFAFDIFVFKYFENNSMAKTNKLKQKLAFCNLKIKFLPFKF